MLLAFSSSSSFSQGGAVGKAADLLNDITSGVGASANAVASAGASAGASAEASAGALASIGGNAFSGTKASTGASSSAKAGVEGNANVVKSLGSNEFGSVLSSTDAIRAGAASVSNAKAATSAQNVKELGFDFGNKQTVGLEANDAGKATTGSFASSSASATSSSENIDLSVINKGTKLDHSVLTGTVKQNTDGFNKGAEGPFITNTETSHYMGHFPGPEGSILESKPVPGAKYMGSFPGPAGSIYDSKPASQSSGFSSSVSANAVAAAAASSASGVHYTGPFPGPVGSILDSKPLPVLSSATPITQAHQYESVTDKPTSGAAFATSHTNSAKVSNDNSFSLSQTNAHSQLSDKKLDSFDKAPVGVESAAQQKVTGFTGSVASSQARAGAACEFGTNEHTDTLTKSTPVLAEQPAFGASFASSYADASSKASAAKGKYFTKGSFETPDSGALVTETERPLQQNYAETFSSKNAGTFSQSSASEQKHFDEHSFSAPIPSGGVAVIQEEEQLKAVHPEAPADVVIVNQQPQKPLFSSSHSTHFGNSGSHAAKFDSGGSYGYHHTPVAEVVVLEKRPHAIPESQAVLVEEAPIIMSGIPNGGVILVEEPIKKSIYSHTLPVAEAPRSEEFVVHERPVKPFFEKSEQLFTVVPAAHPSTVPIGSSCGFRTGCSGYGYGGNRGSSTATYKGVSGNFGSSYRGSSNTGSSNTASFATDNNKFYNSNAADDINPSLDITDSSVNHYGVSNSHLGANSAAVAQASAESYGAAKKTAGGSGATLYNSYRGVPTTSSEYIKNAGNSGSFGNSHGGSNAFHSGLKTTGTDLFGITGNSDGALANSASYSNAGVDGISGSAGTYKKGSNSEGSDGSIEGGSKSGAFATAGSFSSTSNSHGLLKGLINGLESPNKIGENTVTGSGEFSSAGLLSSLLGKVKGLADVENGSSSVSGSFSSSHSSAASSAHSNSFAASSSKFLTYTLPHAMMYVMLCYLQVLLLLDQMGIIKRINDNSKILKIVIYLSPLVLVNKR